MEVKIGVQSIPRELVVDTDSGPEAIERALTTAVSDSGIFVVHDDKGGTLMVPADKIGYVEFSGNEHRRVGFGSL